MTNKTPRGIDYLNILPLWAGSLDFSLSNPIRLMEALGDPQDKPRSLHISGTNGKGSTAAFAAAMLRSKGYTVAQLASPHLTNVTERCIINGKPISQDVFSDAIDVVVAKANECAIPLTYFELTTAASFLACADLGIDCLVVEVGLGGRLDATNVLSSPVACSITSISLDHTHVLGHTLTDIAREKAGIIKPGVPVYVGRVKEDVRCAISEIAIQRQSPIFFMGVDFDYDVDLNLLRLGDKNFTLNLKSDALHGAHQIDNASIAAAMLMGSELIGSGLIGSGTLASGVVDECDLLSSSELSFIERGVSIARWPGRLESLEVKGLNCVFDAAHNPGGMSVLLTYIESYLCAHPEILHVIFLVSFLETKNWRDMVSQLEEFSGNVKLCKRVNVDFWFTKSCHPQAVEPEFIVSSCGIKGESRCYANASQAISALHDITEVKQVLVVIAGSIYLLGDIYPLLEITEFKTMC